MEQRRTVLLADTGVKYVNYRVERIELGKIKWAVYGNVNNSF